MPIAAFKPLIILSNKFLNTQNINNQIFIFSRSGIYSNRLSSFDHIFQKVQDVRA